MAKSPIQSHIDQTLAGMLPADAANRMIAYARSVDEATKSQAALNHLIENTGYAKQAAKLQSVIKLNADLMATEQRRHSLLERQQAIQSGYYAKRLADGQKLLAQERQIEQAERRVQLQMQLGRRLGAGAFATEQAMNSRSGKLASNAGAGMFASAMAGFSGTVEGNRLQTELQLVSRELAGALKPAIEGVTEGLKVVRGVLEKLGPAGQNVLMTFMLLGAGRFALGRLGGLGAMASAIPGAGLASGLANRAGLGGGAGMAIAGRAAIPLAIAAEATAADAARGDNSYYHLHRQAGHSRLTSWLVGSVANSIGEQLSEVTGLNADRPERIRADLRAARVRDTYGDAANPNRRTVTPGDASFDAVGSAYERIGNTAALNYVQESQAATRDNTRALEQLTEYLRRANPHALDQDQGINPIERQRGRN